MNMDRELIAVCKCGKDELVTTLRKIKNAWPFCQCRQAMRITTDVVSISPRDRMGDAGSLPEFVRLPRGSDRS